ncbi:PLP-dependent transferase [Bradyrhizobium arachidis]|nr:PLP-dependent transferase [Bradyrhizobium arachidis]
MRAFADNVLARLQIKAEYFCPTQPSELAAKIDANTRAIYLEPPSSMTFEVQDLPALAAIAHQSDALVIMDNTWAAPLYFRPFEHVSTFRSRLRRSILLAIPMRCLGLPRRMKRHGPR